MVSLRTTRALLLGADESLASLLADVLGDLGIALFLDAGDAARPDLVLAHVERGEAILPVLTHARDCAAAAPVVVLLPFADERLVSRALCQGARACFALGRPLDELRALLRSHFPLLEIPHG
ncbi:DNA-binding response regulator [Corallococcus sp. CA054B]|nr:DNA-binding response regulator [Corallococcus sp. CA054B]